MAKLAEGRRPARRGEREHRRDQRDARARAGPSACVAFLLDFGKGLVPDARPRPLRARAGRARAPGLAACCLRRRRRRRPRASRSTCGFRGGKARRDRPAARSSAIEPLVFVDRGLLVWVVGPARLHALRQPVVDRRWARHVSRPRAGPRFLRSPGPSTLPSRRGALLTLLDARAPPLEHRPASAPATEPKTGSSSHRERTRGDESGMTDRRTSERALVIGDGSAGGPTLALRLARNGIETTLWSAFPEQRARRWAGAPRATRRYLPGHPVPRRTCTSRARIPYAAAEGAELVVSASCPPSTCATGRDALRGRPQGRDAHRDRDSKGLEIDTFSHARAEILRTRCWVERSICVLTGPSHAEEVAHDLPASVVAGCDDDDFARLVQGAFNSGDSFRVYTSADTATAPSSPARSRT